MQHDIVPLRFCLYWCECGLVRLKVPMIWDSRTEPEPQCVCLKATSDWYGSNSKLSVSYAHSSQFIPGVYVFTKPLCLFTGNRKYHTTHVGRKLFVSSQWGFPNSESLHWYTALKSILRMLCNNASVSKMKTLFPVSHHSRSEVKMFFWCRIYCVSSSCGLKPIKSFRCTPPL